METAATVHPQAGPIPVPDPNARHMHRPSNRGGQEDPSERTTRPRTRPGEPAGRMWTMQRREGPNVRPSALRNLCDTPGARNPCPGVSGNTVGAADFGLYGSPHFQPHGPELLSRGGFRSVELQNSGLGAVRLVWPSSAGTGQWPPAALVLRIVPNEVLPGPRTDSRFHS